MEHQQKVSPYEQDVRECLAYNKRKETYEELTPEQRFSWWCAWQGFIGYASTITDAIEHFEVRGGFKHHA